jgi:hypothetical protein
MNNLSHTHLAKTQKIRALATKKESVHEVDADEIRRVFGFDPEKVGTRHVRFWLVQEVGVEEEKAGAQTGDLCVQTLDTGAVPQDLNAKSRTHFVGTSVNQNDRRIRYYYFRPPYRAVSTPVRGMA